MKRLLLFFTLLVLFQALPTRVRATHAAGAELVYEWVSDSTYRLIYKFYRACGPGTTADAPTTQEVCYYDPCNSGLSGSIVLTPIAVLPDGRANGSEVSTGCPGFPTYCSGGNLPGYQEWWYDGYVTLPEQCDHWTFYTSVTARNAAITNLQNPGSQALYVEATLNNLTAQGNSSPYFTVKPVPYVCNNSPYNYNNGAVDPNNDSVAFSLLQPRTIAGSGCGPFAPNPSNIPFSFATYNLNNNPFSTNNTFSLDPLTGQITFTPNAIQNAVVTVIAREYRNGVLIGSVIRDVQIAVLACNSQTPTVSTAQSTIVGAAQNGNIIQTCAKTRIEFCIDLKSGDTSAILVARDNHGTATPGATINYFGQSTDSIRACFSWLPSALDTGYKLLSFTVKDSSCRPPGIPISQTFTIPVRVFPVTEIFSDTTVCQGDTVRLRSVGGPSLTWEALPGGSPITSLSCTTCRNPVATPDRTTSYVLTSDNLQYCNKNKDTVTITVVPTPSIYLGPDLVTCIDNPVQLDINLQAPANPADHKIRWTPSTALSNDTIPNPVSAASGDISYSVVVSPYALERCSATDTIRLTVLQGFQLFNPDTAICKGNAVQTRTSGDQRYTFEWVPTSGVSNPDSTSTTITPDTSGYYTLITHYPTCRDSARKFYITVEPNPVVDIGPDRNICKGDTASFDKITIEPSDYPYRYDWQPGNFDNSKIRSPIYTPRVSATVVLTVTTPLAGCVGRDSAYYTSVNPRFIQVSADTAICPGDSALLRVSGTQVSQVWSPGEYLNGDSAFLTYAHPIGTTVFSVRARNEDNCVDSASVRVTVFPEAVIDVPDSAVLYPGESYQLNPQTNCLYFEWFPPAGLSDPLIAQPVAMPDVSTRYFVVGRTEPGCTGRDSFNLIVVSETPIDVPNAFSPGSDPNGRLRISFRGIAELKSFKIFNRWGTLVFETRNISEGWDGTYNGVVQPVGVYLYMVEAVTSAGKKFIKNGNITLLR